MTDELSPDRRCDDGPPHAVMKLRFVRTQVDEMRPAVVGATGSGGRER